MITKAGDRSGDLQAVAKAAVSIGALLWDVISAGITTTTAASRAPHGTRARLPRILITPGIGDLDLGPADCPGLLREINVLINLY